MIRASAISINIFIDFLLCPESVLSKRDSLGEAFTTPTRYHHPVDRHHLRNIPIDFLK